jgi:hypothetical protein
LSEKGIRRPEQLVLHLLDTSKDYGFDNTDLIIALVKVAAGEKSDPSRFIELLKSKSEGQIRNAIENIDSTTLSTKTIEEITTQIYVQLSEADKKVFALTLTDLAVLNEMNNLLETFASLAEGELRSFIQSINPSDLGLSSSDELIRYLYSNADKQNFSISDVDKLLSDHERQNKAKLSELQDLLIRKSGGSLHDFIANIDFTEHDFKSELDFINYLYSNTGENYSAADLNSLIGKILLKSDLQNIIDKMAGKAGGSLRNILENLNIEKENIYTLDELIEYLLSQADDAGYTANDVYNLLMNYPYDMDLQEFKDRLTYLADGSLKNFLSKLDLKAENINTIDELIAFLLKKSAEEGFSKEDVFRALKALLNQITLQEFIQRLIPFTSGNLRTFLENLDLGSTNINTVEDLMEYLASMAETNRYSIEDLNEAMRQMFIAEKPEKTETEAPIVKKGKHLLQTY